MKWEALKKKCADDIAYDIKQCVNYAGYTAIYALKKMQDSGKLNKSFVPAEHAKVVYDMVMNWDIREIDELAKFFPDVVPSWIKSGNYETELGGDGWEVVKTDAKKYADGGLIDDGKVDKIEYAHPSLEVQDAIEFLEANTNYRVKPAPAEKIKIGAKHFLVEAQSGIEVRDVDYFTDVELVHFAKEKGFGKFRLIDIDNLVNDTAKKCEHLECDGTVRVLHYVLDSHSVPHYVFAGSLEINSKVFSPHFWIGLPDGRLVDFKARMWFGNDAPNGIFYPKDTTAKYDGTPIELEVSALVYKSLLLVV